MEMSDSAVSRSHAAFDGGGMYVKTGSKLAASTSSFDHNSADAGGGVFVDAFCEATFARSVIADNSASFVGGGLYANRLAVVHVDASSLRGKFAVLCVSTSCLIPHPLVRVCGSQTTRLAVTAEVRS